MVKPQTTIQILRCFTLGGYSARVVDGHLETEGPQPLAGPLPASIKARRDELIAYLNDHCGGTWPAAPGSEYHTPPSREAQRREWLQTPREERVREFRRKLRGARKQREEAV